MLSIIGIGLNDSKDITLKGLELVKQSEYIYLENYTSKLDCSIKDLEELYGKKVILAERAFVEDGQIIIDQATTSNVALLIIGDVFSATTHISIYQQAKEAGIEINIINNASVLTAIGITGLQLYKFGKTTSISFHESDMPTKVIKENGNMHTLCLLDLTPKDNVYMQAKTATQRLIQKGLDKEKKIVVCAQLGSKNPTIQYLKAKDVQELNQFPQCIIIPGDMHFLEEEMLENYLL
jgi:diphthine synthase